MSLLPTQKARITPGLLDLSTRMKHRPQKAPITPGLLDLSTRRPQARQNNLKIRHQTEVGGWGVGGQVFVISLLTAQKAPITPGLLDLSTRKKHRPQRSEGRSGARNIFFDGGDVGDTVEHRDGGGDGERVSGTAVGHSIQLVDGVGHLP
ncbi:hypothetical protein B0H16DRAFT_1463705 [Mycena metata]|uniref:Uncharacterized protein n=1 Tax=Mycena metata TaxID=1033252 RepID=A0AAD7IHN7_9AGAR|nr:hypothetical protein B0H16DRAFT_1463705 [Mycena metata]